MSNHLAIAHVTAALQHLLMERALAAQPQVSQAQVYLNMLTGGPTQQWPGSGINVYLYQVVPNAAHRNNDLPTRSFDPTTLVRRPCVALDLHYLLTFFGDPTSFEPERLLAATVRALHTVPILTTQRLDIATMAQGNRPIFLDDAINPPAKLSNLDDQFERVKFTPLSLSVDEMSRLWSGFSPQPYRLSVAYQASVILIEEDIPVVEPERVAGFRVDVRPEMDRNRTAASDRIPGLSAASAAQIDTGTGLTVTFSPPIPPPDTGRADRRVVILLLHRDQANLPPVIQEFGFMDPTPAYQIQLNLSSRPIRGHYWVIARVEGMTLASLHVPALMEVT